MTTDFMLTLAKLFEHCPKCRKTTLDNYSKLDISSNKLVRTCSCGYSIEISINESINENANVDRKILLEEKEQSKNENKITNLSDLIQQRTPDLPQIYSTNVQEQSVQNITAQNSNNEEKENKESNQENIKVNAVLVDKPFPSFKNNKNKFNKNRR